MNHLIKENACKSLNFIIKIHALLRKFIMRFFHLLVSLIEPLKRLLGQLWLKFAPNLLCWTLNHQHAYVECELKKISQLYRQVLMVTINYRFVAVRSNEPGYSTTWNIFLKDFGCEAFGKYSWCKNWSRTSYRNAEFLVNGLMENWPKIRFFIEKLCLAAKLIFGLMDMLISRIVDFGVKINQKYCKSYQFIQEKLQFVAVYGLVAALSVLFKRRCES